MRAWPDVSDFLSLLGFLCVLLVNYHVGTTSIANNEAVYLEKSIVAMRTVHPLPPTLVPYHARMINLYMLPLVPLPSALVAVVVTLR